MTADTITAIKKALEGVTPGPWHVERKKFRGNFSVAWKPELKVCQTYGDSLAAENDSRYIAAVNPAAITELILELETSQIFEGTFKASCEELQVTLESLQRENEELRSADLPQTPWPASDWALDRITELEKALKPFAEVADFMDSETTGFSMTDTLYLQTHDEVLPPFLVDVFCLERFYTARTALSSTGDTHGN